MCWSARAFETGPGRCSAVRHEAVFIVAQGVDGRILACGEPIDRVYLNVYVPMLQAGAGTAHFLPKVRGNPVLSSALMEPITRGFVVAIKRYSATEGTDLIQFERTERQDERTGPICSTSRRTKGCSTPTRRRRTLRSTVANRSAGSGSLGC